MLYALEKGGNYDRIKLIVRKVHKMAVTTKDLARICGVSRATINRALNNLDGINEKTKKRILDTAKELGYEPDLVARSLVKGKSMTIGVIVVDLRNEYFAEMINEMEKAARASGYILNITLHEQDKKSEKKLIQTLVGHRIDGLIISPVSSDKEFLRYLNQLSIPVVVIGNQLAEAIPCVGIDEQLATEDAVEYIYKKGYQKAAFVVPPLNSQYYVNINGHEQRLMGFLKAVNRRNLEFSVIKGDDYCSEASELLQDSDERIAFLCSGAKFAGDLIFYFNKNNKKAGTDYGIMSFDKIDIFKNWEPEITTVDNHISKIGASAVRLLIDLIEGKEADRDITIPYEIVQGDTL